jgi:hypothetical protein
MMNEWTILWKNKQYFDELYVDKYWTVQYRAGETISDKPSQAAYEHK